MTSDMSCWRSVSLRSVHLRGSTLRAPELQWTLHEARHMEIRHVSC
jgi:hypothetical protein